MQEQLHRDECNQQLKKESRRRFDLEVENFDLKEYLWDKTREIMVWRIIAVVLGSTLAGVFLGYIILA